MGLKIWEIKGCYVQIDIRYIQSIQPTLFIVLSIQFLRKQNLEENKIYFFSNK